MIIGVIAFFSWAAIARIVRGQTLSIKEKEYIEAARSLGAGPFRIMFLDILPNLLAPVLVLATLYIPTAVVFEATLSYLGLGIQPPVASWGNILADAQNFYQVAWWYVGIPRGGTAHHHARVQPVRRRDQGRDGPAHRAGFRGRAGPQTPRQAPGARRRQPV